MTRLVPSLVRAGLIAIALAAGLPIVTGAATPIAAGGPLRAGMIRAGATTTLANPISVNTPRAAVNTGRVPDGVSGGGRSDTSRIHLGPKSAGTSAFVVWPAGSDEAPAVIVVHEWWGLNAQIREVARRFAAQGYVAIVPDLYHGKVAADPERAQELMRGLEQGRALEDLHAARRWLREQARTRSARVGVVGFSMGGSLGQMFATDSSEVAAVVTFYGAPDTDAAGTGRRGVPLLAHFGAQDEGIPMTRVGELKAELRRADRPGEVHVYPGAGHGFMAEGRPSYHADAARQAWARTLAFLQRLLKS